MPKLIIGQYRVIRIRINCAKISSLFEIVNMGIFVYEICPNLTFLEPGPTLGSTYLIIVGQIQVKLFSTQTYFGKVLLQSTAASLDFPLWSYSPLKIWKKIGVVNLTTLAPHHRYNFQYIYIYIYSVSSYIYSVSSYLYSVRSYIHSVSSYLYSVRSYIYSVSSYFYSVTSYIYPVSSYLYTVTSFI